MNCDCCGSGCAKCSPPLSAEWILRTKSQDPSITTEAEGILKDAANHAAQAYMFWEAPDLAYEL